MIDFELMPHQKEAVFQSDFQRDMFLAWDMGVGKTCATIQILRRRYMENERLMKTLILSPLITLKNWKKEIEMFSKIPSSAVIPLTKSSKRSENIASLNGRSAILIMNYEALSQKKVVTELLKWSPEIIVADESHNVKSYKSKRAKVLAQLADGAQNRYLLTGTPILKDALDLYMQFRILDGYKGRESTFGTNFFAFRAQYFEDENAAWSGKPGYFPSWVPRTSTYEKLNQIMKNKMSRVKKSEVLKDLPELVTENRYVELSKEQKQAYMEMKKNFLFEIEQMEKEGQSKAVIATQAVTRSLKMQQIVAGAVNTSTGHGWYEFENIPRMALLKDLLQEITPDHKVIVWACFKANYDMIAKLCDKMGIKYTRLHGEVKPKDKYKNQEEFNNDPDVRVLIGNPAAGGVGINLVAASYMIYYSRSPKLGDDAQSESRNYRKGSEIHDKITRINIIAPDTIDDLIDKNLSGKIEISEAILNPKNY